MFGAAGRFFRSRYIPVALATAVYVVAFLLAGGRPVWISLALLPVSVAGWQLGLWGGLQAGLLFIPFNALLLTLTGQPGWQLVLQDSLIANLSLPAIGAVVGSLRDLLAQVRRQSAELEKQKAALEKAYQEQLQQTQHQAALYEVLRAVGQHLDPETTIRTAVEALAQWTNWPAVQLLTPDPPAPAAYRALVVRARAGPIPIRLGTVIPIAEGIIGRAFRTGEVQYVADVSLDPDYLVLFPTIQSEMAIPLRHREQVLGVLNVESHQLDAFTADDIRLAESLAETVALALDNANLYRETQQRLREQSVLRQAATVISTSLELETVLNQITQQMAQAVDATSAYFSQYDGASSNSTVLAEYFSPNASEAERLSDLGVTYLESDRALQEYLKNGRYYICQRDDPALDANELAHMVQYGAETVLYIPLHVRG